MAGISVSRHASETSAFRAEEMQMTDDARVQIMEMVRDQGMSMDEAFELVKSMESAARGEHKVGS